MSEVILKVEGLHKFFDENHVLRGIDLEVKQSEMICLIGASGSGKSTFLRCINFMESPSAGQITIHGDVIGRKVGEDEGSPVFDYRESELVRVRTKVGMVFQQFNLFPHMTVLENVMEGLVIVLKLKKEEAEVRARLNLSKVGLLDKADQYPSRLSGGQQQRVAIARALAMEPDIMLFDEVTSSLDPELVGEVLSAMRDLSNEGMTMIVVSHEMGFAKTVADTMVFMDDAEIVEIAPPDVFFSNPESERTQLFLNQILTH